jgi:hypothetical protein
MRAAKKIAGAKEAATDAGNKHEEPARLQADGLVVLHVCHFIDILAFVEALVPDLAAAPGQLEERSGSEPRMGEAGQPVGCTTVPVILRCR